MSTAGFDVIVVGVGAMGATPAGNLLGACVRAGPGAIRHPQHARQLARILRMIRMAYYEHPDYVPLLRRAYERWEQLEEKTGEKILYITGGLYMGRRERGHCGFAGAARQHQLCGMS